VESLEGTRVRIRLAGRWETDHEYEGRRIRLRTTGDGLAIYDTAAGALEQFLLVCHGVTMDEDGCPERPTAAVAEWRVERWAGDSIGRRID
jgi:hypothetical protein